MRNPRFLHASFTWAAALDNDAIEAVMGSESFDWVRYASNSYLLWSSSDCEKICRKLLRVPGMNAAFMLVCAVEMHDGFGSLPQWVWDWIRKDRGSGSVELWSPNWSLPAPKVTPPPPFPKRLPPALGPPKTP